MAASMLTLQGVDEALSNLNYRNKGAPKTRLIHAIRGYYETGGAISSLHTIDQDQLIRVLWNTANDAGRIKDRRKNLSSVRSSVNTDLQALYKEGKNPEGISIGPNYVFVISDEAKEKILESFKDKGHGDGRVDFGEIANVLNIVSEYLSGQRAKSGEGDDDEGTGLQRIRDLVRDMSEKLGMSPDASDTIGEEVGKIEVLDEDEVLDEALEVIEDDVIDEELEIEETEEDTVDVADVDEVDDPVKGEGEDGLGDDKVMEIIEDDVIDEELEIEETEEDTVDVAEGEDLIKEVDVYGDMEDEGAGDRLEGMGVGPEAPSIPDGLPEAGAFDIGPDFHEKLERARVLAEAFHDELGAMDKVRNQYILIPGDRYRVGSSEPLNGERPEQVVDLQPFYMGKFPVTNALFEIFVEKTGYRTTGERTGYGTVYYGRCKRIKDGQTGLERSIWNATVVSKKVGGACWYQPMGPGSNLHKKRNHPVVQVSLEDAIAFAAWTGKRLPTENEWEAASRTTKGHFFPWGNEWQEGLCNTEASHVADTTPVDRYLDYENDLGMVDMIGNVLEWTMDGSGDPFSQEIQLPYYIIKGGSWVSEHPVPLMYRLKVEPDFHSNILGFRCAVH